MIVSALLQPNSIPNQAVSAAIRRGEILLSNAAVEEIAAVLRRPKFDRYILAEERDRFLATLIRRATLIDPKEQIRECRDPKDDKWLELAIGGGADRIISGDADLLQLKSFRGIPVVAPSQFLDSLPNESE